MLSLRWFVSSFDGVFLQHVLTLLRLAVPARALLVIHASRRVNPNHSRAALRGFIGGSRVRMIGGNCGWLRFVRGAGLRGLGLKRESTDDNRGRQKSGENEQTEDRAVRAAVYRFASH
jgi:hypothetical protein